MRAFGSSRNWAVGKHSTTSGNSGIKAAPFDGGRLVRTAVDYFLWAWRG